MPDAPTQHMTDQTQQSPEPTDPKIARVDALLSSPDAAPWEDPSSELRGKILSQVQNSTPRPTIMHRPWVLGAIGTGIAAAIIGAVFITSSFSPQTPSQGQPQIAGSLPDLEALQPRNFLARGIDEFNRKIEQPLLEEARLVAADLKNLAGAMLDRLPVSFDFEPAAAEDPPESQAG